MAQAVHPSREANSIDAILRDELAESDRAAGNHAVILRHLLRSEDHTIFSDEVIARVRGMAADIARQLVLALAEAAGHRDAREWAIEAGGELELTLFGNQVLLAHLHALALEWELVARLEAQRAIDPVLSPLLQGQIASPSPDVAANAMRFLGAQARFCQAVRRMEHPLAELPGDLLQACLLALRAQAGIDPEADRLASQAEQALRVSCEGHQSRARLATVLLGSLGGSAAQALSLDEAGPSLFLSALALGAGIDRDAATMAMTESQMGRLVLLLATCGLKPEAIRAQFAVLHPDIELPDGLDALHADTAAALLQASAGAADR